MLPAQTDVDSHHQYALLIHSLTHEHTQSNVERHVLLIQKWIRDNDDGILLQDLESVSEILKIVKGFLSSNYTVFRPVVTSLLALCCKPLLETKANERLRVKGIADIKVFFRALTAFSIDANNELKIEIVHCLRCIINGGKDSLVLRTDVLAAKVRKNKVPITDTSFIQSLVRDSSIIDFIVLEFQDSTDNFEKATTVFAESSMLYSQRSTQLNSRTTAKQRTLRETSREYGIPEDCIAYEECSQEEKEAPCETEIMTEECSDEVFKTLPMIKTLKVTVTLQDRLTTDLLELCADLAEDPRNAQVMIAMRMCDGIMKYLELLVKDNVRDKRVHSLVELTWTLLDSYLNEGKVDLDRDDPHPVHARGEFEYDPHNLSHIIDQATALSTLHHMITIFAQDGFKHPDKECRNEVLAVLTLLAESSSSHTYFIESGLLNDFVYYACFAECSALCETFPEWLDQHPQSSSNPRNFGTTSEIDLQFKRGLWILISDLLQSDDPNALACVGQSPLLLSLLFYLEYDSLPMDNQKCQTPEGSPPRDLRLSGVLEEVFGDVPPSFADSSQLSSLEQNRITGSMVSGEESRYSVRMEEPFPDRFSVTKESEDVFRNRVTRTVGRVNVADIKYITGNIGENHTFLGSIPHVQMLQLQVLAATLLTEMGAKFVDDFMMIDGPVRVLEIAMHYCKSDASDHISLVGVLLICLNRLIASSPAVRSDMESKSALQFFLFLSERSVEEQTKAQAVRAIALLCASVDCQTQLRDQEGIQFLVLAVRRFVEPKRPLVGLRAGIKIGDKHSIDQDDPSLTPSAGDISVYVVALIDCISRAIAGNERNEYQFAKHDGLDILLELIETSPLVLRLPAMRLLSDLLENIDLVPYVRAWRSPKTMRSAVQLATHCWLDEKVRLGGVRGGGVITNILDPLGVHNWPAPGLGLPLAGETIPLISFSMSTASMGTETTRSLAVSRLSAAILHSRVTDGIPVGNVPLSVRHAVLESDIRGVVASVLQLLGAFNSTSILGGDKTLTDRQDDDTTATPSCASSVLPHKGVEYASNLAQKARRRMNTAADPFHTDSICSLRSTLNPSDSLPQERNMTVEEQRVLQEDHDISLTVAEKQVVAIARRYAVLKEGGWWSDVSTSLRIGGIIPIESDMTMLRGKLEDYFNTAQMVHMEQIILKDVEDMTSQTSEKIFLNQIGSRMAQDTRAATSKGNSRMATAKNTLN